MLKRTLLGLAAATLFALPLNSSASAETYGGEGRQHSRTEYSSHERDGARSGGHQRSEFRDSRADRGHVHETAGYREHQDHH